MVFIIYNMFIIGKIISHWLSKSFFDAVTAINNSNTASYVIYKKKNRIIKSCFHKSVEFHKIIVLFIWCEI